MKHRCIERSTEEPLTIEEIKEFLRLETEKSDSLTLLLKSSRETVENIISLGYAR